MIIEIKLKDPKYCNGCPLIGWTDIGSELWCEVDGGMESYQGIDRIPRPKQCTEKYGE